MEIMLIAVVSPLIRCEWQLQDWQVALVTTVSDFVLPSRRLSTTWSLSAAPRWACFVKYISQWIR